MLVVNVVFLPDHRTDLDPAGAAVSDSSQSLTNAQLLHRVRSASRHLKDLGVRPGDVVALKLTNRVEVVLLLFAAWRLGAAISPINPSLTDVEVDRQLADSGARLLVAEDIATAHDGVATLAVGDLRQGLGWPDLPPPPDPSEAALLIYSGGTTGQPKGVMLDHANLAALAAMARDALEIGPADRCLLTLPLSDVNGVVVSVLTPLLAGASVVIADRLDPRTHRMRLSPEVAEQRIERDEVAVAAEASYDADAHRGQHGRVAKLFPRVNIGKMRLDDCQPGAGDRVPKSDAVVSKRPGIEDDSVDACSRVVEPSDEFALDVRLKVDDGDIECGGVDTKVGENVIQRVVTVDLRFSRPEEVEVRSVEDQHGSRHDLRVDLR
jgi:hypothetical protein